jgi:hypothetical protein
MIPHARSSALALALSASLGSTLLGCELMYGTDGLVGVLAAGDAGDGSLGDATADAIEAGDASGGDTNADAGEATDTAAQDAPPVDAHDACVKGSLCPGGCDWAKGKHCCDFESGSVCADTCADAGGGEALYTDWSCHSGADCAPGHVCCTTKLFPGSTVPQIVACALPGECTSWTFCDRCDVPACPGSAACGGSSWYEGGRERVVTYCQ